MQPGDRFTVTKDREVRNAKGRLLARFRPEFDYAVTTHNLGVVAELEQKGIARPYVAPTGRTNEARAAPAQVKGRAKTGKGK